MKWIALAPMSVILTACGYTSAELVEYRQVSVTPVVTTRYVTTPVVSHRCCNSVVTVPRRGCCPTATTAVVATPSCCGSTVVTAPAVYSSTTVVDTEPVDVTTTNVEYY